MHTAVSRKDCVVVVAGEAQEGIATGARCDVRDDGVGGFVVNLDNRAGKGFMVAVGYSAGEVARGGLSGRGDRCGERDAKHEPT